MMDKNPFVLKYLIFDKNSQHNKEISNGRQCRLFEAGVEARDVINADGVSILSTKK